jgi:hypothetical protein
MPRELLTIRQAQFITHALEEQLAPGLTFVLAVVDPADGSFTTISPEAPSNVRQLLANMLEAWSPEQVDNFR